jgi:hypothetical protein
VGDGRLGRLSDGRENGPDGGRPPRAGPGGATDGNGSEAIFRSASIDVVVGFLAARPAGAPKASTRVGCPDVVGVGEKGSLPEGTAANGSRPTGGDGAANGSAAGGRGAAKGSLPAGGAGAAKGSAAAGGEEPAKGSPREGAAKGEADGGVDAGVGGVEAGADGDVPPAAIVLLPSPAGKMFLHLLQRTFTCGPEIFSSGTLKRVVHVGHWMIIWGLVEGLPASGRV